ncbi:AraC family transcriptional regulator [Citrobacter koseri]|uniref:AraC family transcriptional regulator n=1 Tax=Citrobacter koseri TaxID=545 RepID=A0A078LLW7_CITKO|nr:AraC family transcriptional regulator [Citrobacter koseri]SQB25820.1 AraC family transcriptional regulator [Citrobacter koseri]
MREGGHRFERVRDYLHDNYMHPVTLDELARVASLSPWHFQRQFKAHFHVTPHQMLMAIRLWRAKAFLTLGMPAADVAAATGLTDQSHLTRAFTHRYGITPVRYQKQVYPR